FDQRPAPQLIHSDSRLGGPVLEIPSVDFIGRPDHSEIHEIQVHLCNFVERAPRRCEAAIDVLNRVSRLCLDAAIGQPARRRIDADLPRDKTPSHRVSRPGSTSCSRAERRERQWSWGSCSFLYTLCLAMPVATGDLIGRIIALRV